MKIIKKNKGKTANLLKKTKQFKKRERIRNIENKWRTREKIKGNKR